MQANELRIGNWVNIQGEFDSKIHSIENGRLWCKDGEQMICSTVFEFHPIPLTPEVLEKCGFVGVKSRVDDSIHKYRKGGVEIFLPEYGFCYYDGDCWTIVKSLHQLQNLYFALTCEELEYKQ